jgi:hypothetical protein
MDKFAEGILSDITTILGRPVFTNDEEAVISDLINVKVNKLVDESVQPHKYEVENLTNFINFQLEEGADFHDITF